MGSNDELDALWCQTLGNQGPSGRDKAVDHYGLTPSGSTQNHPSDTTDLKPANLGQDIEAIPGIRQIHGK